MTADAIQETLLAFSASGLPKLNLQRPEIAYVLGLRSDPADGSRAGLEVVDTLISSGELPSFKIGGTRLARLVDVIAFNNSAFERSVAESKEADAATSHTSNPDPSDTDASAEVGGSVTASAKARLSAVATAGRGPS